MNVLQPVLDFLLSFLKLSTNKILIGLLTIALSVSVYMNIKDKSEHSKEIMQLTKEHSIERDTLRSIILNTAIKTSAREIQMAKDCYDEKQNISDKLKTLKKE